MRRLRRIFLARAATTLAFAVLTTVGAWAQQTQVSTTYIDADDQSQTVDAYVLDGSETTLGVEGSETSVAYVANSDINFDNVLTLASDVIIILGDGKTVNFGTDTTPLTAPAIYGSNNYSLAIYSQSRGENMGKLNIYSSNIGIQAKKLTIGGGDYTIVTSYPCLSANDDVLITGIGSMTLESESNSAILSNYDITISGDKIVAKGQNNVIKGYIIDINATSSLTVEAEEANGIYTQYGCVTITGGQVTVTTENSPSIYADGLITIGLTKATDFFLANKGYRGTVEVADGQTLKDEKGNYYCGRFQTEEEMAAISGQKLTPCPPLTLSYTETEGLDGSLSIYTYYRNNKNVLTFSDGVTELSRGKLGEDHCIYIGAVPDVVHSVNGIEPSDFTVTAGESESIVVQAVTDSEGQPIPGQFKFPVPDDEDAISISFTGSFSEKPTVSITYIDAADQQQTVNAYVLDGTETTLGVEGSTTPVAFVANSDINYDHGLILASDVIFIIGDGKTVNFGTSENRIYSNAFSGMNYKLGIYCQSRGENMGKMTVYGQANCTSVKTLTIGGGEYMIDTYSPCLIINGDALITGTGLIKLKSYNPTIQSNQGNITVRGGSINAETNTPCIQAISSSSNVSITGVDGLKLESNYSNAISCGGNITISGTANSVVKINDETSSTFPAVTGRDISIIAHDLFVGNLPTGYQSQYSPHALYANGSISISADNIVFGKTSNATLKANSNITITDFSLLTINPVNGYSITAGGSLTITGKENSVVKVSNEDYIGGYGIGATGNISITAHELYAGNVSTGNAITCNGLLTIIADKVVAKGAGRVIVGGSVTINAANSLAVDALSGSSAISGSNGDVTITGGQVTVKSQYAPSIDATNNLTLGWTNASDFFLVNKNNNNGYYFNGTVKVAEGQSFMDEDGNIYSGTLTDEEKQAIGGKKLKPYNPVTLALAEGQTWTTYYQNDGLAYSLSEGAQAYYVSDVGSDAVTLTTIDCVPSGLPVLINGSGEVTLTPIAEACEAPDGADAQFQGTAKALEAIPNYDAGRTYVLYHGQFLIADTNSGIAANKCWLTLNVPEVSTDARLSLVINDDATSIASVPSAKGLESWYDLQGRRLNGEPTQHGLYIYKGKKVKK